MYVWWVWCNLLRDFGFWYPPPGFFPTSVFCFFSSHFLRPSTDSHNFTPVASGPYISRPKDCPGLGYPNTLKLLCVKSFLTFFLGFFSVWFCSVLFIAVYLLCFMCYLFLTKVVCFLEQQFVLIFTSRFKSYFRSVVNCQNKIEASILFMRYLKSKLLFAQLTMVYCFQFILFLFATVPGRKTTQKPFLTSHLIYYGI